MGAARAIVKKITFKKLLTFGSRCDNIISVKGEMRKKKSSKKLKKLLTNKFKDDIIKSSKKTKSKLRKNEVGNYDKQNDKQSSP